MTRTLLLMLTVLGAVTQAAQRFTFEVTSVKPSAPDEVSRGFNFNVQNGRLRMRNQTLKTMITFAYGEPFPLPLPDERLSGGPDWLDTARFTVEGKAAEGTLTSDGSRRIGLMLRALLEDRFKLIVETETRKAQTFALVLARGDRRLGPKLRENPDCGTGRQGVGGGGPGRSQLLCAAMSELAFALSEFSGRPVADRTGLTGRYDGTIEWAPSEEELGASIFTALKEQFGLKLQPEQGHVDYLIVRRAEKPAEN